VLRNLLLGGSVSWSPAADTLLHFAARTEHADKTIRPALAAGIWVVCDRFYDSTMVYQGWGLGSDRAAITTLIGLLGLVPDLTLVLDVTVETTMARLASRGAAADRYERLGAPFFARIREGFQAVVAGEPNRCVVLDGTPNVSDVASSVMAAVCGRFTL
jgi:dTMP kinase